MRQVLSVAVRLVVVTAAILTVAAVALGRYGVLVQEERRLAAPRFQPIADALFREPDDRLRLLDLERGTIEPLRLSDGGRLVHATCSPWRDGQGRMQVVGTWISAPDSGTRRVGLARYTVPGGELLDRVELEEPIPRSGPCWFPDMSSRIVFVGYNGRLYCHSFEETEGALGPTLEDGNTPRPVAWPSGLLAPGRPRFLEAAWPTDPRLDGRLIAAVSFTGPEIVALGEPQTQLWWLRLKSDGSALLEGGRLIADDSKGRADVPVVEERMGRVSVTKDGRLALAYLVRRGKSPRLDVQLAPLTIDAETGIPRVEAAAAVTVARDCAFAPPAFSEDGRWIFAFPPWPTPPARFVRAAVIDALDHRTHRFDMIVRSGPSD